MLGGLYHLRLDLGYKRCRTLRIVQRDEVANLREIHPRGGQNDQAWHGQVLAA